MDGRRSADPAPGDPWSQWGGQQQQEWPGAGGLNSLRGPRQIFFISTKKMFAAAVPAPIPTRNMFSALADNIGSDGQASTVQMTLGELAVIRPSRPRRGKKSTFAFSVTSASEPSAPVSPRACAAAVSSAPVTSPAASIYCVFGPFLYFVRLFYTCGPTGFCVYVQFFLMWGVIVSNPDTFLFD